MDYLKYDNCNSHSDGTLEDHLYRYSAMGEALLATGRPIVYSVCQWGLLNPWEWAPEIGNLWRTTFDIHDRWDSLKSIIAQNAPLFWAAEPGAWNDPDMLQIGNGGMTTTEYETHFAMWAMMAAPLLIGTDLREATDETLRILSNAELIAVDQDPLGVQGQVLFDVDGKMVLSKPLVDQDRAVALYNSTDAPGTLHIRAVETGLPLADAYRMTNLWTGAKTQTAETISASVPAHGTSVYRVEPTADATSLPPATILDFEVTTAIEGGPGPALLAGQDGQVAGALTNLGLGSVGSVRLSAHVPAGWTLEAEGPTCIESLGTDESFVPTWTVGVAAQAAPGTYELTLTATYRWGPNGTPATTSVTVTALVLAPAPAGVAALSSLTWASATNGWGPVEIDTSNGEKPAEDGNPITVGGQVYERGLGTHAPGEIIYYLGGRCSALITDVGIDDEKTANASASFIIYADDQAVAESGTVTGDDPAMTLTADLTGATWLRLVTDAGPTTEADRTDWAAPMLTCAAR